MSSVPKITVKVNEQELKETYEFVSLEIQKNINKINTARMVLVEGDLAKQEYAIIKDNIFAHGSKVEILLGYEGQEESLVFKGIIVSHKLKLDSEGGQLTLEMKGLAFKLTTVRKNCIFEKKTDEDIITSILEDAGFDDHDVASLNIMHEQMVQYYCTDWDFILSRAEANGCCIVADDETITIKELTAAGANNHEFNFANNENDITILEAEMEADIRHQLAEVKAKVLDMVELTYSAEKLAKISAFNNSFLSNLDVPTLTEALSTSTYELIHAANLSEDELQAWAKAKLLKNFVSMLKGRIKILGNSEIKLGDLITISGTAEHFNDEMLVTGIRHELNQKGWETEIQFGLSPDWLLKNTDVVDMPAAGLLPAVNGLQTAKVVDYQEDETKNFRIRVQLPQMAGDSKEVWARLTSLYAGDKRGIVFRPEVGDEVVLGFFNNDPRYPVILGSMHSENRAPLEEQLDEKNNKKSIVTREHLNLMIDDEEKTLVLQNAEKEKITITNEKDKFNIEIMFDDKNKITLSKEGIEILTDKTIKLTAEKTIECKAKESIELTGEQKIQLKSDSSVVLESGAIEMK